MKFYQNSRIFNKISVHEYPVIQISKIVHLTLINVNIK